MSHKKIVKKIFDKAIESVKAETIVKKNISIDHEFLYIVDEKVRLDSFKNLYVFSVGKAGFHMAKVAEDILGSNIKDGISISLDNDKLKYIKHFISTHPKVSHKSLTCANHLVKKIKSLKKDDLFIFFLSGGASAMVEKPKQNISFKDFEKITSSLLTSGIDIKALNEVRKSISLIKGGKLAQMCKAKGYVLVLSDVIGNDLSTIGSALMYDGKTPHYIIGDNNIALMSAKKYIERHVQKAEILTTTLDKNSKDAAKYICKMIDSFDKKYDSFCLLIGGETTVKVTGSGNGGRSSELALRLLDSGCINEELTILCAGSDGIDGNSDANGAFIDVTILKNIKESKLNIKEYLQNSDSNSFFKKIGYEFKTGLSGTNVMDFVFVLKLK